MQIESGRSGPLSLTTRPSERCTSMQVTRLVIAFWFSKWVTIAVMGVSVLDCHIHLSKKYPCRGPVVQLTGPRGAGQLCNRGGDRGRSRKDKSPAGAFATGRNGLEL